MLASILNGGGVSPEWLATFQKGEPGAAGIYFSVITGKQNRLYGPIQSRAHGYLLSALVLNTADSWPQQYSRTNWSTGRGVSEFDKDELRDLVRAPDSYDYSKVWLLPVSKLKLGMPEDLALQNLRMVDFPYSGWARFFGFEPDEDRVLFPFAMDEHSHRNAAERAAERVRST
jgi:hypothetical protein